MQTIVAENTIQKFEKNIYLVLSVLTEDTTVDNISTSVTVLEELCKRPLREIDDVDFRMWLQSLEAYEVIFPPGVLRMTT